MSVTLDINLVALNGVGDKDIEHVYSLSESPDGIDIAVGGIGDARAAVEYPCNPFLRPIACRQLHLPAGAVNTSTAASKSRGRNALSRSDTYPYTGVLIVVNQHFPHRRTENK